MNAQNGTYTFSGEELAKLRDYWAAHQIPPGPILDVASKVEQSFPAPAELTGKAPSAHWPPNKLG